MPTEEEKKQIIKLAFLEYAKENELSAFNTTSYYSRQFLHEESFFLKVQVINELIGSGIIVSDSELIIKYLEK